MRPRFLQTLSTDGRAVVHSSNGGKPIHLFHWYEDGGASDFVRRAHGQERHHPRRPEASDACGAARVPCREGVARIPSVVSSWSVRQGTDRSPSPCRRHEDSGRVLCPVFTVSSISSGRFRLQDQMATSPLVLDGRREIPAAECLPSCARCHKVEGAAVTPCTV
ncbi:DUF6461 domain-containing protein [Streptomyces hirsutus]|uniref:DUF6461 domain-containing protein n=1 Tax=Streptomyces hirsutus TaxID=35620 RepID=UPI0036CA9017